MSRLAALPSTGRTAAPRSAIRAIEAVELAGRYLSSSNACLVQALAAQVLLGRMGRATRVQIGVAKDEVGNLVAHAWVEGYGRILIGGSHTEQYVPLLAWGGEVA
jgi:Transglutaminase-like superfamily